ncbi:MAG: type II TA system antitoxin MqsA family protein [Terriglobales bacterium]
MRACPVCGGPTQIVRHDYVFNESGLSNVVLEDIEFLRCKSCNTEVPRIPRLNDLIRAIALAVITKPYELTGEEIRFLRKYAERTAAEFAELLGVDASTLSRWENDQQKAGDQSDRLIRLIALGIGEGLKEKLETTIHGFRTVGKKPARRVTLSVNPQTRRVQYKDSA